MQRSHTLPFVLTLGAACGSGPAGPKAAPIEPIEKAPPRAIVTIPTADAATSDAAIPSLPPAVPALPDPPKLACDGTNAIAAPFPEPTWFCARADGTPHGAFVTLFPDQSIEIEGAYREGKLDGAWTRRHAGGAIAETGAFAAGLPDGTWRQLDPLGKLLGEYKLALGTGKQKKWLDDGTLYSEVALRKGVPHGPMRAFDRAGHVVLIARFDRGKLHGDRVVGSKHALRIEETFSRGTRRGRRTIWQFWTLVIDEAYDARGKLDGRFSMWRPHNVPRVQGEYAHGKRVGSWVWTDRQNHVEREGDFADGKKSGLWSEYTDARLTFQGTFTDGKPDGEFVYYARTGAELGRFSISDGTGTMLTFHGNRQPASKARLRRGELHGKYEELTPMGVVIVEGTYAAGKKHGTWREWSEAGALILEAHYQRGKLDGTFKKFVEGKLAVVATYLDGKVEGDYIEYRGDQPSLTGQFVSDRRSGTWTAYASDRKATLTATYKDGVLDGPWRHVDAGEVVEGGMVAGRRAGAWTRTDPAGNATSTIVKTP